MSEAPPAPTATPAATPTASPATAPSGAVSGVGLGWFLARSHEVLTEVGSGPVWALSDAELTTAVAEVERLVGRLMERKAALLVEADRRRLHTRPVAAGQAATSTPGWQRTLAPVTAATARADLALAEGLDRHEAVRVALAAGEVLPDQARVIMAAVDALPEQVGAELRARAVAHLLGEATGHGDPAHTKDAATLTVLGRHLLHVVDPDLADEVLDAQLRRQERDAARATTLTMWDDGNGRAHGRFTVSSLHGQMLRTALEAIANPTLPAPLDRLDDHGTPLDKDTVRGRAFGVLLERLPTHTLPTNGGVSATVVVTIPMETLEGRLTAAGILGTDLQLSAGQARRLACAAGVIPAVLDGASQVLDLGRRRRLHTRPQRLALAVQQDGRCAIGGCQMPAAMCDAHHPQPWSHGGPTSLGNGVLLCSSHHTLAHTDHHELRRHPDGTHRYHRRT